MTQETEVHQRKKDEIHNMMDTISWKVIDQMFSHSPTFLIDHHLDSYNDFIETGISQIIREYNPIQIRRNYDETMDDFTIQIDLYIGGKDAKKLHLGKPIIFDEDHQHYMYPNEARLRNMTYGVTFHYDCEIEIRTYSESEKKMVTTTTTLTNLYMGKIPIMLNSKLCILHGLDPKIRLHMGECRYDLGGYFIIDGKEKMIIPQEKFADNMLYIKENPEESTYSHSAIIRMVSEDASKPVRTLNVHYVAPGPAYTNGNIVVDIPNVRKAVPLFILMRALGLTSDKDIIRHIVLDIEKDKTMVERLRPCVHDAASIFTQETALNYISSLTKYTTNVYALQILMDYFLPNVGELNFSNKAFFIGHMVNKLLRVVMGRDLPTDRDSFHYKRVELPGTLMYDLFREYYVAQKRSIFLRFEKDIYFHHTRQEGEKEIVNLDDSGIHKMIEDGYRDYFREKILETGLRKAFKGNWGMTSHTKRDGIVQDVSRLSYNAYLSQLRKLNLPLDASAKVVGPRLLHSTQWGVIDPIDTPDGGNVGLHKHLALATRITNGYSAEPMKKWLQEHGKIEILDVSYPEFIYEQTKVFVNGIWLGFVYDPVQLLDEFKLQRRLSLIPVYTSISFHRQENAIEIFTDGGRLCRPIFYTIKDGISFQKAPEVIASASWSELVLGFAEKKETANVAQRVIYAMDTLYGDSSAQNVVKKYAHIDYMDTNEAQTSYIASDYASYLAKGKKHTHVEIHPSLLLGVMGNQVIFPENNPPARNLFSCGQTKQAVSMYHTNYQHRVDKTGIVLQYGQVPLIKSRYLEHIQHESMPYGVNTIVAIMSYTGYNVEDAILVSQGAVDRGLFRTTYYNSYETHEESTKVAGTLTNANLTSIEDKPVNRKKRGYDYTLLDERGLIREGVQVDEKTVLIGKATHDEENDILIDASIQPKRGQKGLVDRVFLSDNEEGFRIAKVRIRDERIPAIGDKMASRAGQKGTIGLVIPEKDMPFTSDGVRPDLIINPHAIPSRMTIGQLVESVLGKVCAMSGNYGDCTAFMNQGSKAEMIGSLLTQYGFHSSGNEVLYDGFSGRPLETPIFIGPTYYMRLKHMVKDKLNYRGRGPRTMLTRQTVQGRANEGGLRIGEMERDGVIAHGASAFLRESFMVRGDEYQIAVCNNTGHIAVYNAKQDRFFSPMADGPVVFQEPVTAETTIRSLTQFGRSFSIVKIPYSLKLLIQELQGMHVQMRIVTEDNISQLDSLHYSDNASILQKGKRENIAQQMIHLQGEISDKALDKLRQVKSSSIQIEDSNSSLIEPGLAVHDGPLTISTTDSPGFQPGSGVNPEFPDTDSDIPYGPDLEVTPNNDSLLLPTEDENGTEKPGETNAQGDTNNDVDIPANIQTNASSDGAGETKSVRLAPIQNTGEGEEQGESDSSSKKVITINTEKALG